MAEANATTQERTITLEEDAVAIIRRALLVGLSAYGELERLRDAAEIARMTRLEIPEGMEPIGVSIQADEVSNFAEAIRYLEVTA